jgi:4-amino-4-deoxy-L-arabinose transferase-like glycosyltransferase
MNQPRGVDYLIVGLCTAAFFAVVLAVGGPLTLHEGVLSQTSTAMLVDHDWIVPHFGEAPWLERPPLPQWFSCALAWAAGTDEWVFRIGPAISATITILLTLWLAGRLFGRAMGILSALILATMYNFTRYATLAEADMFLAPIVAGTLCVFTHLELLRPAPGGAAESVSFWGKRPWAVAGFFVLLGATNLAKGLVFGTVMALAPVGVFVLWNFSWRRIGRYAWLWGWLLFAVVGAAWPLIVLQRYPDAPALWSYDLFGRLSGHYLEEPKWYYFGCLTWVLLPWTIPAVFGMVLTWPRLWREADRANRLIWCWAWAPPLVFSLAQGKHHHYMIHFLAPWAVLAAQGSMWIWARAIQMERPRWAIPAGLTTILQLVIGIFGWRLPGHAWLVPLLLVAVPATIFGLHYFSRQAKATVAVCGVFAILFVLYSTGFAYKSAYLHRSLEDTAFLRAVRQRLAPGEVILVFAGEDSLEGLRLQYYLGKPVIFLHNASFMHDERIPSGPVYLVTRNRLVSEIEPYGKVEELFECGKSRREESPADRWGLFRLQPSPALERKNAKVRISPLQGIYRAPGPNL